MQVKNRPIIGFINHSEKEIFNPTMHCEVSNEGR